MNINVATEQIVKGDYYQHQNGGYYRVEDIGTNEPDLAETVAYRSMQNGKLWFRSVLVFLGQKDGRPRFIHKPNYKP